MMELPEGFSIGDAQTWPFWLYPAFGAVIFTGLEILAVLVPALFYTWPHIPVRGKHLDELSSTDKLFVVLNKCSTCLFVYHCMRFAPHCSTIKWTLEEATVANTVGSLIAFYAFYDFFYMWFHWLLHNRSLYRYIHKHHHRQKAPSRGNVDAINVHPFEFITGEYLHLITILVIPCHVSVATLFVLVGGLLASLNHTRFDVVIPFLENVPLYDVKVHDVHHRIPESNYAQYTMFWDRLFGFFRPYDAKVKN